MCLDPESFQAKILLEVRKRDKGMNVEEQCSI